MSNGPERNGGGDPDRGKRIPEWARQERVADMAWIAENIHLFWPAAQQSYQAAGRGGLYVDTTVQPEPEAGHPFWYLPQETVEQLGDADAKRMVANYNPANEMVISLLKSDDRVSTYRIQLPAEGSGK